MTLEREGSEPAYSAREEANVHWLRPTRSPQSDGFAAIARATPMFQFRPRIVPGNVDDRWPDEGAEAVAARRPW